jgi:PAS domain S-box-containing protein
VTLDFFQLQSLKTRVTLFTLAIFLIGIWSLEFFAVRELRTDMQHLLSKQQYSTVSFVAAAVDQELKDRFRVLEQVAGRVTPALLGDPAALQSFLEARLILEDPFNGGVIAFRPDGTAMADLPFATGRIGLNYLDSDTVSIALREGKATVGRPVLGKKLPAPVFSMTVPIRGTRGEVIGALAGVTNLGKPNFLDKITADTNGGTGGYLLLIDPRDRLTVTSSDRRRIMATLPAPGVNPGLDRFIQGYEGTAVVTNPLGVEVLTSVKGVPAAGWFSAVSLPTAEAFAPIRAMQRRFLIAAVILSVLAAALTRWVLSHQLAPVLATSRTLATLSEENQPLLPLPVTSQDEIGDLIRGFNRLLETLGQREQALRMSEEKYRSLFHNASLGIFHSLPEGRFLRVNPALARMLGYDTPEELMSTVTDIRTQLYVDSLKHSRVLSDTLADGSWVHAENRYRRKDGTIMTGYLIVRKVLEADGTLAYLEGFVDDISERKRADEQIRRSLAEKTVMLKEIHHRVKNNMQVIHSLLNLQARGITDTKVRAMFEESRNRIASMALIHERLYQSHDLAHVDFKLYLQSLVAGVADTYKRQGVAVTVEMEPLELDVNVGIPCGLIVNELVSNSLKYAFPGDGTGKIQVGITRDGNGNNVLTVADNGVGLPDGVNFRSTASLGLQLVNVLVGQIRGTIELDVTQGTAFRITFPAASREQING